MLQITPNRLLVQDGADVKFDSDNQILKLNGSVTMGALTVTDVKYNTVIRLKISGSSAEYAVPFWGSSGFYSSLSFTVSSKRKFFILPYLKISGGPFATGDDWIFAPGSFVCETFFTVAGSAGAVLSNLGISKTRVDDNTDLIVLNPSLEAQLYGVMDWSTGSLYPWVYDSQGVNRVPGMNTGLAYSKSPKSFPINITAQYRVHMGYL